MEGIGNLETIAGLCSEGKFQSLKALKEYLLIKTDNPTATMQRLRK